MALPDMGLVGYTSGNGTSVGWEIRGAHRWAGEREREEERRSCCGGLYFACIFYSVSSVCVCVCVRVWSRERDESYRYVVCEVRVRVVRARLTERSTIDVEREI